MKRILSLAFFLSIRLIYPEMTTASVNVAHILTTDNNVIQINRIDHLSSFRIPTDLKVKVMILSKLADEPPNSCVAFFLYNWKRFEDLNELHFEDGLLEHGAIFTLKKFLENEIRILGHFKDFSVTDEISKKIVRSTRFTFRKNTVKLNNVNYHFFHRSILDFNLFQPNYDVEAALKKFEDGPWIC